ncbi:MAG: 50S ribosomal protein L13 [Thermoplasmata archaeon]|nr:50S ribosomal protein L13 [Thermoplasmata archaeon]
MAAVIDATDTILGRLASVVAKRLLEGEEIVIVNAERAVITGRPKEIKMRYKRRRELGGPMKPSKGPFYPRLPDRIVRRTIRGMLPYKKPSGRAAYKRCMVYIGVPKEYEGMEFERIDAPTTLPRSRYVYVGEVSTFLGAKIPAIEYEKEEGGA